MTLILDSVVIQMMIKWDCYFFFPNWPQVSNPVNLSSEITWLRRGAWVYTNPRHERVFLFYISDTRHARALPFSVDKYLDRPNKSSRKGIM